VQSRGTFSRTPSSSAGRPPLAFGFKLLHWVVTRGLRAVFASSALHGSSAFCYHVLVCEKKYKLNIRSCPSSADRCSKMFKLVANHQPSFRFAKTLYDRSLIFDLHLRMLQNTNQYQKHNHYKKSIEIITWNRRQTVNLVSAGGTRRAECVQKSQKRGSFRKVRLR